MTLSMTHFRDAAWVTISVTVFFRDASRVPLSVTLFHNDVEIMYSDSIYPITTQNVAD